MATIGQRKIMAKDMSDLFISSGRVLTEQEYINLSDEAPYRLATLKSNLGIWPRIVEKAKTANPIGMAELEKPTILQAIKGNKGTNDKVV